MSRDHLTNVAASVRQRLLNRARERDEEYQLLLERYVQERFLYRLERSEHADAFILKGALLFIVWQGERHRVSRDLDLLGAGAPTTRRLERLLKEICQVEAGEDGVRFLAENIEVGQIREDQEYEGLRAHVEARVGSARIRLQIDVGFGDATWPPPERTAFPVLLGDFESPRLRAYSRESVVAEKFQAMVDLGMANSRMKDFYDVWFLAERFNFEGKKLAGAIQRTFERRRTPLPDERPLALTKAFADNDKKQRQWEAFVRKGRIQMGGVTLSEVIEGLQPFLTKPTDALTEENPFGLEWPPGGPWQRPE